MLKRLLGWACQDCTTGFNPAVVVRQHTDMCMYNTALVLCNAPHPPATLKPVTENRGWQPCAYTFCKAGWCYQSACMYVCVTYCPCICRDCASSDQNVLYIKKPLHAMTAFLWKRAPPIRTAAHTTSISSQYTKPRNLGTFDASNKY